MKAERFQFRLAGLALAAFLVSSCGQYGYRPYPGYYHGYAVPKVKNYHADYKVHPHGAPPGQVKKYYGGGKAHPHVIPPGQAKKYRY